MSSEGFGASIFDMDGLLIDSEPLWQRAEVEILGALGVPLDTTATRATKGMYVREVTRYWFERWPWVGPHPDEVGDQVVEAATALVVAEGELRPGVHGAIELCRRRGLPLALASSSEYRMIERVLDHFGLRSYFGVVRSAEDEAYGKPNPAVFLSAASALGVRPEHCVVWEDSPAGVLAAKAARMACVAVPDPEERGRAAFAIADVVLESLVEMDDELFDRLAAGHLDAGAHGLGDERGAATGSGVAATGSPGDSL